jgi:hypothetical protein
MTDCRQFGAGELFSKRLLLYLCLSFCNRDQIRRTRCLENFVLPRYIFHMTGNSTFWQHRKIDRAGKDADKGRVACTFNFLFYFQNIMYYNIHPDYTGNIILPHVTQCLTWWYRVNKYFKSNTFRYPTLLLCM